MANRNSKGGVSGPLTAFPIKKKKKCQRRKSNSPTGKRNLQIQSRGPDVTSDGRIIGGKHRSPGRERRRTKLLADEKK